MSWGGPGFVIAIIALCYGGWLVNTWIRARHGYALEDEWGGKTERGGNALGALREENAALRQRVETLEERTRVLEMIVTDEGQTIAREIEALREPRALAGQQETVR